MHTRPRRAHAPHHMLILVLMLLVVVLLVMIVSRGGGGEKGTQDSKSPSSITTPPDTTTPPDETPNSQETLESSREAVIVGEDLDSTQSARIGCLSTYQEVCTIRRNDPIFQIIGTIPSRGLLIDGRYVNPRTITFQVDAAVHDDEQIRDAGGNVLVSTGKDFEDATSTLHMAVGIERQYFEGLGVGEQRTLYTSQAIRSFLAMFGDASENYPKVEQFVRDLGIWQPRP